VVALSISSDKTYQAIETLLAMSKKNSNRVWVVVEVQSGIPALAEVFSDRPSAEKRETNLRKKIRPDYDEVGVFETTIKAAKPARNAK
jgi:hypothetical protein